MAFSLCLEMDKRKLKQASVEEMQNFNREDVLNSESVNRAFLHNAELVFELEKQLKLKAQLRYLEEVVDDFEVEVDGQDNSVAI